jgi:hypothetical protein
MPDVPISSAFLAPQGQDLINLGPFSAINTNLLTGNVADWFDAEGFDILTASFIGSAGISAGQIIFEQTNDPVNAPSGFTLPYTLATVPSSTPASAATTISASTTYHYAARITSRYVRIRISTGFVGGTVRCAAQLLKGWGTFTSVPVYFVSPPQVQVTSSAPVNATLHTAGSAASTNATSVKASAGQIFCLTLTNMAAAVKYFKLYNKASAPTVGTDVPVATIPIPATSSITIDFGAIGSRFTNGIAYAITNLMPDADTTAVAAGDVKVKLDYT